MDDLTQEPEERVRQLEADLDQQYRAYAMLEAQYGRLMAQVERLQEELARVKQ